MDLGLGFGPGLELELELCTREQKAVVLFSDNVRSHLFLVH